MKGLLIPVALVLTFCNSVIHEVAGEEHGNSVGTLRYKDALRLLLANEHVIIRLGKKLIRLKKKLRETKKAIDVRYIYTRIETDVNRLEGNGCESHELQCGSEGRHGKQCISELLVCDGFEDCINGQDEDPKYCDVSEIHSGMSFSGYFKEGRCGKGSPDSYYCRMVVVSVQRSKVYPTLMTLKMHSWCNVTVGGLVGGKETYAVDYRQTGTYQIANRRWRSGDADYSGECYFTDNTFRAMWCKAKQGLSIDCGNDGLIVRDD